MTRLGTSIRRSPVAGVTVVDIGVDTHSPLIDLQFPLPGTSDWNTSLTLDASGNAYAVFVDSNMKNTVAKVTPGGVVTTQIIDTTDNDPDGHNTPSIAIDGDGFLHVAYNMHGAKFRPGMNMRKSPTANSVAGVWTDEGDQMPGSFTYPAMSTAPNGDVYLAIRNGTTGDPRPANLFHYDTSAGAWNDRGDFAQESGYTAYLPAPYVASDGKVHLVWHWAARRAGRYQTSWLLCGLRPDRRHLLQGRRHAILHNHYHTDHYHDRRRLPAQGGRLEPEGNLRPQRHGQRPRTADHRLQLLPRRRQ